MIVIISIVIVYIIYEIIDSMIESRISRYAKAVDSVIYDQDKIISDLEWRIIKLESEINEMHDK
jgi:hypothetical protein